MTALICGSLAFDTVMVFPRPFKDHILPDKIHMLNVAFLAPKLTRYFGGCAGNIAFNLKLLGAEGYAGFTRLSGQPAVTMGVYQLPEANALGVAPNQNGGAQFVSVTGPAGGAFGRGQRDEALEGLADDV